MKSVGTPYLNDEYLAAKPPPRLGAGARGGPRPGTEAAEAGEVRLAGPRQQQQRTAARSSGESGSRSHEPGNGVPTHTTTTTTSGMEIKSPEMCHFLIAVMM